MLAITEAQKLFNESQGYVQRARVESIVGIWESHVNIRNNLPPVFLLIDSILENEFGQVFNGTRLTSFPDIKPSDIERINSDYFLCSRKHLLLAGDNVYGLHHLYAVLILRIAFLFMRGREKGEVLPWYHDIGCLGIIESICSDDERLELDNIKFGKIKWVSDLVEGKLLKISREIIDGSSVSTNSIAEYNKIIKIISKAEEEPSFKILLKT